MQKVLPKVRLSKFKVRRRSFKQGKATLGGAKAMFNMRLSMFKVRCRSFKQGKATLEGQKTFLKNGQHISFREKGRHSIAQR